MLNFLKTEQGLISERYIVTVDAFEEDTVQVAFLAGADLRYAIASKADFISFQSGESPTL